VSLETPWGAGRLRSTNGAQRLLFGQMHEDAEVERVAFQGRGRVFCIASAGCTAMRLCEQHEIVACDINPVQLAYAERRMRGAPADIGDAERAMAFLRRFMPLVGWRAGAIDDFLTLSNVAEQAEFWRSHLDTKRFRASFDILMSRAFLRTAYSPQFLSFLPARFGSVLRRRLERGFSMHPNATNTYARALLLGEAVGESRPMTSRVQFVLGDAAAYLESCNAGYFDAVSLSNILDGTNAAYRDRLLRAVRRATTEDAVIVMRSFAEPAPELANNYAEDDRAMIWGVVSVCSAQSLVMMNSERPFMACAT
jgi:S-adenosylmethionine:diacylglycerol 3-amino-3-carboxypropyl transferase